MKRTIALALAAFLAAAGLTACGAASPAPIDPRLRVVATIFAPYDFAREIVGGLAEVTMLLPPGSESHHYEPTPQDMLALQRCNVFAYVGGESDSWVSKLLGSMDTSAMQVVTLMDCVEVVEEEIVPGMEAEPEDEPAYDEHVWTSPKNAKLIVRKLSEAICAADPENAAAYRANTEAYLAKLDALDAQFQAIVDSAARDVIVFGDRFPFRYLTDAYGLRYCAAFPGCAAETEAGPRAIRYLINEIKTEGIPVVFHIELSNQRMAQAIAKETGARVRLLHACHNISKDDFEGGASYLRLMEGNALALREALH